MKFLSNFKHPVITITRTTRTGFIDEISNQIVLNETITKIEIAIPAIWQHIKDSIISLLLPRMALA